MLASPRPSSVAFFVAILVSAFVLGSMLPHAFALRDRIALPRDEYFLIQQISGGWQARFLFEIIQFVSTMVTAYLVRRQRRVLVPTLFAMLFWFGAEFLFWKFAYPAAVTTANWTVHSDDWASLRQRWEYSQAAAALLQVLVMGSLIIASTCRLPPRQRHYNYY